MRMSINVDIQYKVVLGVRNVDIKHIRFCVISYPGGLACGSAHPDSVLMIVSGRIVIVVVSY